jgi:hypothetical protein
MRAMTRDRYGSADVLELSDIDSRPSRDDELLPPCTRLAPVRTRGT